ncbi:MAG: YccF domain-containing protein [Flavisolibacter sp.]
MNTIGNIIWLIFGGLYSALFYMIGGLVLCLTIVGIPFGLQCFKLASFVLWPFGRMAVNTYSSAGCLYVVLNIIWIFCAGLWLAIGHIIFGFLLCLTIIGIPFGLQHFKLVEISLAPFGKAIVPIN